MGNIRQKLSKQLGHLPQPIRSRIRAASGYIRRARWQNSVEWRQASELLLPLKNKYRGCRCVIIGNGPSLQKMDLSVLADEFTFGLNRIYLLFEEWGFSTTYYVCTNPLVIEQSANEIMTIDALKFINLAGRQWLNLDSQTVFIPSFNDNCFHVDLLQGWNQGATVTFAAMQVAYYLGFSQVILIGVDHNFVTKGAPHQVVLSEGADPNHFSPNYFGRGTRWQLPDLIGSEVNYSWAQEAFVNDGRVIVNATIDSKLSIFPSVDFKKEIKEVKYRNKVNSCLDIDI